MVRTYYSDIAPRQGLYAIMRVKTPGNDEILLSLVYDGFGWDFTSDLETEEDQILDTLSEFAESGVWYYMETYSGAIH